MNRKLVIPVTVATAVGVSGTIAKKLALLTLVGIGVPTAGYHFVQAVVSSRAQALSQIEEHRNASQASRMVGQDNSRDVMDDLRSSLIVALQMKDRHDIEGANQSIRDATRVLQRAEVKSRQFKTRLLNDPSVSDDEIGEMNRMDDLSDDLRAARSKLLQAGG